MFVYYCVVETTKQIRASIILFSVCEGGATPGKLIMGLKIVKCNQIVPLGINRVQVGSRYVDIYSCNITVEILKIGNNVLFTLSLESTVRHVFIFRLFLPLTWDLAGLWSEVS